MKIIEQPKLMWYVIRRNRLAILKDSLDGDGMRFVKINDTYYNLNEIQSWQDCDDGVVVTLKNGEIIHEAGLYVGDRMEGADFITQIMPVSRPLAALFKQKDKSIDRADVHALALCADGRVRGLVLMNDGFFLADDFEFGNFIGLDDVGDPIHTNITNKQDD